MPIKGERNTFMKLGATKQVTRNILQDEQRRITQCTVSGERIDKGTQRGGLGTIRNKNGRKTANQTKRYFIK